MKVKESAENKKNAKGDSGKGSWFFGLLKNKTFQKVLIVTLILKILIIAIGTIALVHYPNDIIYPVLDNKILNGWAAWDGRAYLSIVTDGYNNTFNGSGNTAWFPLFPLLMKIFGGLLGGTLDAYVIAGLIISNLAAIIAMFYLYKLVDDEFGQKLAYRTSIYLLIFPTAYFLSTLYAESLFLLLTVAAFYYAGKKQWFLAGLLGFFATLTRLPGIALFVCFVYMYMKDREFDYKKIEFNFLWLFLIPLALLCFMAYLWLALGNPFVFMAGHDKYGRFVSWPWVPYVIVIKILLTGIKTKTTVTVLGAIFNLFMMILLPFCVWFIYKMKKYEYAIYMLITYFMMAISTIPSMSRQIAVLFPVFIVIGELSRNKKYNFLINAAYFLFFIVMVVFVIRHVTGYLVPGVPANF